MSVWEPCGEGLKGWWWILGTPSPPPGLARYICMSGCHVHSSETQAALGPGVSL
jgi:hypothetical protein